MARVNHKKVKQLIQQKRGKITDQEFFISRLLSRHFEDMAAAQTKRYGASRRVWVRLLWQPDNTDLAYTDNLIITINAGNPAVTEFPTREERYQMVCGLFAHELGHCLYTDFLTQQTYRNNLSACRWYPEKPKLARVQDVKNEGEFWEYAQEDPQNLALLGRVAHEISNVLEDAAMENRVLEQFPGTLGQALDFVRAWQWREMPTVTQLKEREAQGTPMFYCLLQLFLSYGKFGELKYGEEPLNEEHIQTVFELLPLLDDDLRATSGKNRWNTVNCILIRCWEHVREYLEALKRRYEEKKASGGTGSVFSQLEEELSTLVGGSTRGEGSTAPVSEESEEPFLPQLEKREKTHALAGGTLSTEGAAPGENAGESLGKQEITSAIWTLPGQKEELLRTYQQELAARGKTGVESRLTPAVQFLTSDIGVSSAKVIALLEGGKTPIHIGSCVAVDHRCWAKVEDFDKSLDQLFAQFQDSVGKLQKLLNVYLDYPVNAMTRVCKKLNLPKKAALEAIHQFEVTYGGGPATAHDVFLAMQEIPFFLSCDHAPESKLLAVAESLARALTFRWEDYDLAKGVEY